MEVTYVVYISLMLVFLIGIFMSSLWYRKIRSPFREIASDLGLDYKKGAPLSSIPVEVTGSYRGRSLILYVVVRRSRHYAETSTNIEISHSGNLKEDVYIFRKGSEWFVKTNYTSGIPEFDRKFRVKGDEAIVKNILDFFIIQKILDLKKIDFIKIEPLGNIILKRWASIVDKEYLTKGTALVVDLAERVERISKR
ncbi:MAG: hypothetical protein QMC80_06085 [Thermoplasmatales archaeon]|nr:hypothetical protein [Thermoplasmatales archaeon]